MGCDKHGLRQARGCDKDIGHLQIANRRKHFAHWARKTHLV
jgi:hypothetical protein